MLNATIDVIKSVLRADATIPATERTKILRSFLHGGGGKNERADSRPKILRRKEVANILGRSTRAVDQLAADGLLPRRTLPGRKRAIGFLECDVVALINSGGNCE